MNRLAISPDEALLAFAEDTELTIVSLDNGRVATALLEDGAAALAVCDGEVWVITDGSDLRLRRYDSAATLVDEAVDLGPRGSREPRFSDPCVTRHGAVLLIDEPVALRPDCGALDAATLRPIPDFAAPVGDRRMLVASSSGLAIADDDGLRGLTSAPSLAPDQELRVACPLPDSDNLALFIAGSEPCVWVIGAERGEVHRRIIMLGAESVCFAAERNHAIVLSEGGTVLTIIDLRFGKPVASHRGQAFAEIAIGRVGGRVVARRLAEDDEPIVSVEYRSLLRSQKSPPWKSPTAKPTARKPRPAVTSETLVETIADVAAAGENNAMPVAAGGGGEAAALAPNPLVVTPPQTDAPIDDSDLEPPPLPKSLAALGAASLPPVARGELALRALERHLALVAALTQRAIATGWDSGRLGFASEGALPFEHEVNALLGASGGRATEQLERAQSEVTAIASEHDATLARDLAACDSGEAEHAVSPLSAVCHEFGLSPLAADILLVVAAPAVWGELARLYGICANDEDRPLCDEWLVAQILGSGRAGRRDIAAELEDNAPLIANGLISVGRGRRPFASLAAHPLAIRRLYGESFEDDAGDELIAPCPAPRKWSELLFNCDLGASLCMLQVPHANLRLVVRGKRGSGRRTLITSLLKVGGRRAGAIDLGRVVADGTLAAALRSATLRGWVPIIESIDLATDSDPRRLADVQRALDAHRGPLIIRCGTESTPPLAQGYLEVTLSELSERARTVAWRRSLIRASLDPTSAGRFAALYTLGPGLVEGVAVRAAQARGAGREDDRMDLVRALEDGIRQVRGTGSSLAKRVERLPRWSQLCLPEEIVDSVREFVGRVRYRRTVFDKWGFDRLMTSSRGITALFEGRPGTGKTMVAGAIARELGCDLYRVDLSAVLSKWIGETEKHLGEIFDAAEGGQMILLFDEADSLFAKRTEVKSSNDRFANIEVNYLLQRLDSFTGIAILTTNFGRSIDPAFKRRLSLRLSFPFPDEDLRERLWRAHLPPELPTAGELDLKELARRYKLSGGYIRNIVLRAAFLAAHDSRPFDQKHLERAVSLEYRATGKLSEGGVLE